jgi:hypothetical protein
MTNTSYNINSLSKEEVSTILEALLFASSVDVVANWYKEQNLNSLELAKKIRIMFPDVLLENIYVYQNEKVVWNDEHTYDILKFFPDLKKDIKELQELDTKIN